jgi:YYY domain-containing protein
VDAASGEAEQISLPRRYNILAEDAAVHPFTVLEEGDVLGVYLPYAKAMDAGAPGLRVAVSLLDNPDSSIPLASGIFSSSPPGEDEFDVRIPFDEPVSLKPDQTYYLRLDVEQGIGISLRGSVIISETTWDLGLPMRLDGRDGFGGLYAGVNQEQFWPDDQDDNGNDISDKLERIVDTLTTGDYLVIPTNRVYGTVPRASTRHPLSAAYYRALFGCPATETVLHCGATAKPGELKGELGYELIAVFESHPRLGPIEINDQMAEEAFTVYDHPKVLIFEKTASFSREAVFNLLGEVDVSSVDKSPPGKLGRVAANLMLSEEAFERQKETGTWAKIFNRESLLNRFHPLTALIWWLVVALIGLLAFPLAKTIFSGLADGGYPIARLLGLAFLSWGSWILGNVDLPYERPTFVLVLAVLSAFSIALTWRNRREIKSYLITHKRQILIVEVIALAFFLLDLGIRLGNPDLWHPFKGGEKPMNFSYLNAILKSSSFPPYDPWYAGGYVNYYYFGYVLVGTPIKLLGIVPSVAYNLVVPTLFSLSALIAYSIGYNLMHRFRSDDRKSRLNRAQLAGLALAIALILLGNLGTARMFYAGFRELGGWQGEHEETFGTGPWYAIRGFINYLTTDQSLPYGVDRWYWDPSRAIQPGPGEAGPITEFPFFTFLYGDLHAHMISLPLTLAALAWAISWLLAAREKLKLISLRNGVSLFFGALILGALRPTNTWDFPTYWALAALAVVAAAWYRAEASWSWTILEVVVVLFILFGLAYFLYEPYNIWYQQGYTAAELWDGGKTRFSDYITVHGLFLFMALIWMAWETYQWMANTPVAALSSLRASLLLVPIVAATGVGVIAWLLAKEVEGSPLIILTMGWAGVLLLHRRMPVEKRIVLILIGTGLAITLLVELVVLRGDIGRMNTVFKFYVQTWSLLSTASAMAFMWVLFASRRWNSVLRNAWLVLAIALVGMAALYPLTATPAKIKDRMAEDAPHSLDGMVFMPYSTYYDINGPMQLDEDYEAIRWMQENILGTPVIVEGNTPEYRWGSRYTIYTGLPGVLGWNWHQRQQRGFAENISVEERAREIAQFYATRSPEFAETFLKEYDVAYVIVGRLEKQYFERLEPCYSAQGDEQVVCDLSGWPMGMPNPEVQPAECDPVGEGSESERLSCPTFGLDKFDKMAERGELEVVFRQGDTTIYEVVR